MFAQTKNLKASEKKLLAVYSSLSDQNQQSVLDFAAFLASGIQQNQSEETIALPAKIAPAENETVVGAIQRLTQVYPMLDTSKMLHVTSDLMSAHILQGEKAASVIEKLEVAFEQAYQAYVESLEE